MTRDKAGLDIIFRWEDTLYRVDMTAYDVGLIKLPDGRVLKPSIWYESLPPQPGELKVVQVSGNKLYLPLATVIKS